MTKRPQVQDFFNWLDCVAPYRTAEPWDPCGFQIGHLEQEVQRCFLALDLNERSLQAAIDFDADLLITHHPVLFTAMQKITDEHYENSWILKLIEHRISMISAHTNLDKSSKPGTATANVEVFLKAAGLEQQAALEVFVPEKEIPDTGLGRILKLAQPLPAAFALEQLRQAFAQPLAWYQASSKQAFQRLVFSPGAFDDAWLHLLKDKDADLLIVGELKHHQKLALEGLDLAFVELNHDASERVVLPFLKEALERTFSNVTFDLTLGFDYTLGTSN